MPGTGQQEGRDARHGRQDPDAGRPWELTQQGNSQLKELLDRRLDRVRVRATWLRPFVPDTCRGIQKRLFSGPVPEVAPLFPRRQ